MLPSSPPSTIAIAGTAATATAANNGDRRRQQLPSLLPSKIKMIISAALPLYIAVREAMMLRFYQGSHGGLRPVLHKWKI